MKKIILLIAVFLSLFFSCASIAKSHTDDIDKIKVASVGDSITYGLHIHKRNENSYPRQLEKKLGSSFSVTNFGVSSATLMSVGNKPYVNTPHYKRLFSYEPDIIIVILGTNDSKQRNWQYKEHFVDDYIKLIESFKKIRSQPKIFICLPPPAFPGIWGIRNHVIKNEIIPAVEKVAALTDVELIDLYSPLSPYKQFFPDSVHPDADGAAHISEIIYSSLRSISIKAAG